MTRLVCTLALALAMFGCPDDGGSSADDMGAAGGAGGQGGAMGGEGGGAGGEGGGTDDDGGVGGAGGGGEPDAAPPPDAAFTPSEGCPAEIDIVRGQLVLEDGSGLGGAKAQLCVRAPGARDVVCLRPADTADNGRFQIDVPEDVRCMDAAVMRNLKPGEQLATTFCQLEMRADGHIIAAPPFVMYATTPATDRPEEGDETAVRTVTYAGGLEIDIVPGDLYTGASPAYPILSSAVVSPDANLCTQGHTPDFAGLIAFSPEADVDGPGLAMRIPSELAEGTTVGLFALGGLNCAIEGETLHEAEWTQFATVTVGAGGVIATDAGPEGLPCFNWLAWEVQ